VKILQCGRWWSGNQIDCETCLSHLQIEATDQPIPACDDGYNFEKHAHEERVWFKCPVCGSDVKAVREQP
jgi:Zn finger protein HypA/HybF involved in hydrogenase expression